MIHWNCSWSQLFLVGMITILCIGKVSSQYNPIYCYECANCTDPFVANTTLISSSTCNTCYKLRITVAYAPYVYVIRKCVAACIENVQQFGGASVATTCCASALCNTSSMKTFPLMSRVFIFLFILLNLFKSFHF